MHISQNYMMIETKCLFGFANDLEKFRYGIGFKLKLRRNNNDKALFRVNAGAGAVAKYFKIKLQLELGIYLVLILVNNDRIIVNKGLDKKNNIDFICYER